MRDHFESAAKYPIFGGKYFSSAVLPALIFYLESTKDMLGSIEI